MRSVVVGNRRISPGAMMALVYCTTVAYGIVVGPRMTVLFAGEAAPLVTLMATALAMALLALYVKLAERFPNLSIFQWIVRLLGPLGYVLAVVLLLYLLSLVAFHGYNFALLLQLLFLNRTPLWVIVIFGYILAFSGAYLGLETMARFFQITMCLELVALPPLLLVGPSTFTWTHFQPWLPMDATTWSLGPLVALGSFVGFAHAPLALYPHIQTGGKILRPSLIGLSLAAVFIVGFTTSVLGVFGPDAVRFTLYPTFDYSQVAQVPLPLSFLARYSLFFSIIWVLAVTKLTMIDLFIVATGIRQILGLRSYQWPLVVVTVAAAAATVLIPDPPMGQRLVSAVSLFGVGLATVVIPVLGLLVLLMRRRADRIAKAS